MHSITDVRVIADVNDVVLVAGRFIFAVLFVFAGIEKFIDLPGTAAAISSKGMPLPQVLAVLTAALELGGGLLIIIGWQMRIAAMALALFTLVATYFYHDFWNMTSGEQSNNMIHALKNLSIFGGFLMLAAVGAGRYSIEGRSAVREK